MVQISGSSEPHIVDLKRAIRRARSAGGRAPFTKAAYRVNRVEDIGVALHRAIRTAVSGRPGGVSSTSQRPFSASIDRPQAPRRCGAHRPGIASAARTRAVDRAMTSSRVRTALLVLGKGAAFSQADKQIRAFNEPRRAVPADVDGERPLPDDTRSR